MGVRAACLAVLIVWMDILLKQVSSFRFLCSARHLERLEGVARDGADDRRWKFAARESAIDREVERRVTFCWLPRALRSKPRSPTEVGGRGLVR